MRLTPLTVQSSEHRLTIVSVGLHKCTDVMQKVKTKGMNDLYKLWLGEYLSGVNSIIVNQVDILKNENMKDLYSFS